MGLIMENLIQNYLNKKMMSQSKFARRVGISRQRLHAYIKNPDRKIDPTIALAIERVTSGEILAYDLIFKGK